jgi:hypothetical protein
VVNIRTDLAEAGWGEVDWIGPAQKPVETGPNDVINLNALQYITIPSGTSNRARKHEEFFIGAVKNY